eukprot:CAMPEP_0181221324 /NCGR_PEP_ID=MMETSP1096-20121128/29333_1 /TAXON_ID=156174 ORGANISM="Chrysochromulina ericina, Strain CCMP281" /NCGR_SAMPLE_ID=MMETSP1096 /ASSEMBLY_ACC=CAM_ASM_000453 /LENGTH=250 /DNA_ID=CAMNT_0023313933 /DNA_START=282 /DNA_END=1039 /DNA_ORIENTATION=+
MAVIYTEYQPEPLNLSFWGVLLVTTVELEAGTELEVRETREPGSPTNIAAQSNQALATASEQGRAAAMTHGAMTLTCSVRKRVKAGVTADLARHFARYVGGDEDEDKRQHDGNEGLKEDLGHEGAAAAAEGDTTFSDDHHGLVLVLMCMKGTLSSTAAAAVTLISMGDHLSATALKALSAFSLSGTSALHRTAVEWMMSGMCGAGSFAGLPGSAFALERSLPPSAARPPASLIAARMHVRIFSIAPSTSE